MKDWKFKVSRSFIIGCIHGAVIVGLLMLLGVIK